MYKTRIHGKLVRSCKIKLKKFQGKTRQTVAYLKQQDRPWKAAQHISVNSLSTGDILGRRLVQILSNGANLAVILISSSCFRRPCKTTKVNIQAELYWKLD